MGSDIIHPGVLDTNLFSQERAFPLKSLILHRQPNTAADVASSYPAGMDDGEMGQGDRMQDR
jgi:hypothetical protein